MAIQPESSNFTSDDLLEISKGFSLIGTESKLDPNLSARSRLLAKWLQLRANVAAGTDHVIQPPHGDLQPSTDLSREQYAKMVRFLSQDSPNDDPLTDLALLVHVITNEPLNKLPTVTTHEPVVNYSDTIINESKKLGFLQRLIPPIPTSKAYLTILTGAYSFLGVMAYGLATSSHPDRVLSLIPHAAVSTYLFLKLTEIQLQQTPSELRNQS